MCAPLMAAMIGGTALGLFAKGYDERMNRSQTAQETALSQAPKAAVHPSEQASEAMKDPLAWHRAQRKRQQQYATLLTGSQGIAPPQLNLQKPSLQGHTLLGQ